MDKFKQELLTVKKFFSNQKIDYQNFIFSKKDEPCDIYCENTKQQFQITWNEHYYQKKIHTTPPGEMIIQNSNINQVINNFIVNPILYKINKYQKSAKEIILLVTAKNDFPLNDKHLKQGKNKILEEKNNFFKEIYIVCPTKNIKIT